MQLVRPDIRQRRREVPDVVPELNPRVGALLDWIIHSAGLYCGVVEVEARGVPCRNVEPQNLAVDRLADVRHERGRAAAAGVVVRAVPREREARLELIRAAHLPAADDRIDSPGPPA